MIEIEVTGLEEAMRKMGNLKAKLHDEVTQAVKEVADMVVDEAKTYAPIRTGVLKRSIQIKEVDNFNSAVTIEAAAPYAGFVEYGTSKQPPQPFMRPPLDHAVDELPRRILAKMEEISK